MKNENRVEIEKILLKMNALIVLREKLNKQADIDDWKREAVALADALICALPIPPERVN
jgi:hypothetical protein